MKGLEARANRYSAEDELGLHRLQLGIERGQRETSEQLKIVEFH